MIQAATSKRRCNKNVTVHSKNKSTRDFYTRIPSKRLMTCFKVITTFSEALRTWRAGSKSLSSHSFACKMARSCPQRVSTFVRLAVKTCFNGSLGWAWVIGSQVWTISRPVIAISREISRYPFLMNDRIKGSELEFSVAYVFSRSANRAEMNSQSAGRSFKSRGLDRLPIEIGEVGADSSAFSLISGSDFLLSWKFSA